MTLTDEAKQGQISAYIEERRQAVAMGHDDTVATIDKELKRLGSKAETPAKRSAKRTKAE